MSYFKSPGFIVKACFAVLTIGTVRFCSDLNKKKYEQDEKQAKQEIVSNPEITGSQLHSLEKRVEANKTTYEAFNDSVNNVKQTTIDKLKKAEEAQVSKLKEEVSHFPGVTAKKFNYYEQRAQKDLRKWAAIDSTLKAQRLFKLAKTVKP